MSIQPAVRQCLQATGIGMVPMIRVQTLKGVAFAEAGGCGAAWETVGHEADELTGSGSFPSFHWPGRIGSQEVHDNGLINRKYAGLYRSMPESCWSGLAAVVSGQVGCAMQMMNMAAGGDRPRLLAAELNTSIEALCEGNVAYFQTAVPADAHGGRIWL